MALPRWGFGDPSQGTPTPYADEIAKRAASMPSERGVFFLQNLVAFYSRFDPFRAPRPDRVPGGQRPRACTRRCRNFAGARPGLRDLGLGTRGQAFRHGPREPDGRGSRQPVVRSQLSAAAEEFHFDTSIARDQSRKDIAILLLGPVADRRSPAARVSWPAAGTARASTTRLPSCPRRWRRGSACGRPRTDAATCCVETGDMVPANAPYRPIGFSEEYRGHQWRRDLGPGQG